jgi:hypothetical protein
MWAMAAFMAVTSAINTYSRSKEAKDAGEALGNSIGGAMTSAMSGAMMGFQIGGGWGALIGGVAGLAVSGVISLVGYKAGEMQRAINSMNELTQAWQNQQRTIQSTRETIDSISDDYERLARGVSSQGRNISLSADEYERYNQIVNQIADMFPEMVRGFTAEGNAILSHRGNVEELTMAYERMQQAARDAILVGADSAWQGFVSSTQRSDSSFRDFVGINQSLSNEVAVLDALLNNLDGSMSDLHRTLREAGISFGDMALSVGVKEVLNQFDTFATRTHWSRGIEYRNINESDIFTDYLTPQQVEQIAARARQLAALLNAETAKVRPILNAYLDTDFNFQRLDVEVQDALKAVFGGLDFSFFGQFDTPELMYSAIQEGFIQPLQDPNNARQFQEAYTKLLTLDSSQAIGQWQSEANRLIAILGEILPEETVRHIKIILGIVVEDEDGNLIDKADDLANTLAGRINLTADDIKNSGLTEAELSFAISLDDSVLRRFRNDLPGFTEDLRAHSAEIERIANLSSRDDIISEIARLEQARAEAQAVLDAAPPLVANERRSQEWGDASRAVESYTTSLNALNGRIRAIDDQFNTTYRNLVHETNLLSDAMAEQARYGRISEETANALRDAFKDQTNLINMVGDEFHLATSAAAGYRQELLYQAYAAVIAGDATEEQIALILSVGSAWRETINRMSDAMSSLTEHRNMLSTVMSDDFALSTQNIQRLISSYPQLEGALARYMSGLIDEATFREQIVEELNRQIRATEELARLEALRQSNRGLVGAAEANNVDLTRVASVEEAITQIYANAVRERHLFTQQELDSQIAAIERRLQTETHSAEEIGRLNRDLYRLRSEVASNNIEELARLYDVDLSNYTARKEQEVAITNAITSAQITAIQRRLQTEVLGMHTIIELNRELFALQQQMINIDWSGFVLPSDNSPPTGGAGRRVEPYHAEISATMLLESRLREINNLLTLNNNLTSDTSDVEAINRLMQERIDLLREQQGVLHRINNINRGVISDGVSRLAEFGIEVEFNPTLNRLEFSKTVEEMESAINSITLGNQEETNAVRRELQDILRDILNINDANERNGMQWAEIQRTIQQINLNSLNLGFDGDIGKFSRQLRDINVELGLLATSDVNGRLEILGRQFETQQSVVARYNQHLQDLQRAYIDGSISSAQFRNSFDDISRSIQDATLQLRRFNEEITQTQLTQWNAEVSATMDIVNMTMRMIQQEVRNEVDALRAKQNALRDMENDLNNSLRDRNKLRDDEIKSINELIRLERERANEAKKALDDQLRAYRDLINLRKRELSRQSEDRQFGQDLEARQLEVRRIQSRLDEIANNDSLQARAERAKLNEELSRRQLDLDNLVFDNDIKNQQRALDDELSRFEQKINAEKDGIDVGLREFERAHQFRIDAIGRERDAHDAMIQAQIEAIRIQSEEYGRQTDAIQDSISRNGDLVRMAMERIDRDGERLYQQLIQWNARYGSGVDADVSGSWRRFNDLVQNTTEPTLERVQRTMMNIVETIRSMEMAQHSLNATMASMPQGMGVRDHFESQGRVVDWHGSTNQFSVDGMRFNASDFTNLDGRLQATTQQLLDLEKQLASIPRRSTGGYIKEDEIAVLHKGERVLTKSQTEEYDTANGNLVRLSISDKRFEEFSKLIANGGGGITPYQPHLMNAPTHNHLVNNNVNNSAPINIEMEFNGVTSESFIRDLPRTMQGVVNKGLDEYKRQERLTTRANGLTGGVRVSRM